MKPQVTAVRRFGEGNSQDNLKPWPSVVRERIIPVHNRVKARVRGKLAGDQLGGEETKDVDDLFAWNIEEEGKGSS